MNIAPYERVSKVLSRDVPEESWNEVEAYRFLVLTTKDDEGTFSTVALNLPGTGSYGPSKELALSRFQEAATGMIESYLESGEHIPWKVIKPSETPSDAKWISVNV